MSKREIEAARLVALGCSDADIAANLGISELTAHKHVESGRRRLGAQEPRPYGRAQPIARNRHIGSTELSGIHVNIYGLFRPFPFGASHATIQFGKVIDLACPKMELNCFSWETEDRSGLKQTETGRRRRAMTTRTWNGSNADWYTNNGGDWSPPGDPGSGDAVVINSGELSS